MGGWGQEKRVVSLPWMKAEVFFVFKDVAMSCSLIKAIKISHAVVFSLGFTLSHLEQNALLPSYCSSHLKSQLWLLHPQRSWTFSTSSSSPDILGSTTPLSGHLTAGNPCHACFRNPVYLCMASCKFAVVVRHSLLQPSKGVQKTEK